MAVALTPAQIQEQREAMIQQRSGSLGKNLRPEHGPVVEEFLRNIEENGGQKALNLALGDLEKMSVGHLDSFCEDIKGKEFDQQRKLHREARKENLKFEAIANTLGDDSKLPVLKAFLGEIKSADPSFHGTLLASMVVANREKLEEATQGLEAKSTPEEIKQLARETIQGYYRRLQVEAETEAPSTELDDPKVKAGSPLALVCLMANTMIQEAVTGSVGFGTDFIDFLNQAAKNDRWRVKGYNDKVFDTNPFELAEKFVHSAFKLIGLLIVRSISDDTTRNAYGQALQEKEVEWLKSRGTYEARTKSIFGDIFSGATKRQDQEDDLSAKVDDDAGSYLVVGPNVVGPA